ncbi:MAG: tRNA dihydrouridine synthase DusB [Nitrospinaceae bacterium]|jgi:nifR3 family TIM-barrel protein|nr:tRNA dihydrouridine synthase DusB [Nitrospina sp.]MBT5258717.1 tRNA dihydrouridine synthase DusB [Nitrospina sp.]MBT6661549.1 tRNA dihydrouridine synthase DusB [Nitrospina sp.]MDG1844157.1 tRNA dihydrouridine synthase DusB [Nitrospinaceae bacterium]
MDRQNSYISNNKDVLSSESLGSKLIDGARNQFWLAPMAGITDVCFRQLMDEMGAGVLVSELVSAKGLLYNSGKTHKMIEVHPKSKSLVGIQLFGESEEDIINAAHYVKEAGASFVDINLGCPVKKVVKKGCGAALMRDPAYLETFLTKIKRKIELPLTVKMRTGWSHDELTIHECVRAANNSGCEWVAIHGRTRAQGYEGEADWNLIAEVKQRAKLPIVGNGDIRTVDQAQKLLNDSGVDAVMIGRGALRNPWIFKECIGFNKNDFESPCKVLDRYLELLRDKYDIRNTIIYLRKFASWLVYGYPGAASFRSSMYQLLTVDELVHNARIFFERVDHFPKPQFKSSESFMMSGHG